jgi:hypothetical protein
MMVCYTCVYLMLDLGPLHGTCDKGEMVLPAYLRYRVMLMYRVVFPMWCFSKDVRLRSGRRFLGVLWLL